MRFCTDFDEHLAVHGPPAVFLPDREGLLRFDAEWTRGAWGRLDAVPERAPAWVLLRDHDTGFVALAYTTSAALLAVHPRMQTRHFDTAQDALRARDAFGSPPVAGAPW